MNFGYPQSHHLPKNEAGYYYQFNPDSGYVFKKLDDQYVYLTCFRNLNTKS